MIDTIVLTLSKDMYQITHPEMFTPSAHWIMLNKPIAGIISKQNPTKKELKAGIYKPHLTISHRFNAALVYEPMLKIELSLPKLLFGNNFNELQYKDFDAVANKLMTVLQDMDVIISLDALIYAPVSTVHYAKNIPFTDGSIPFHYINKIKESNVKLSLDVNQTDYRNDGHCYKWHCNSYEVVFYDKLKDLQAAKKSSKRALEKDSELQFTMLETINQALLKKSFPLRLAASPRQDAQTRKINKLEVLRMEVRLNKRAKMKQLFKKLDIKTDLTFKKLFKPAISKKVLLHYLDELENNRSDLLNFTPSNDRSLLTALVINNPELSPQQIFKIFGFKKALEFAPMRELQAMFSGTGARSWSRLVHDIGKVKVARKSNCFTVFRECLEKFKML